MHRGVTDGALVDGILYVTGYRYRPSPDVRGAGCGHTGLRRPASMMVQSFGSGTTWLGHVPDGELLRASSNAIPLVTSRSGLAAEACPARSRKQSSRRPGSRCAW